MKKTNMKKTNMQQQQEQEGGEEEEEEEIQMEKTTEPKKNLCPGEMDMEMEMQTSKKKKKKKKTKIKQDDHAAAALSLLYSSHTTLAQTMEQVDRLVMKAHKLGIDSKISVPDIDRFSKLLAQFASSLQGWIPFFEDAAQRPSLPADEEVAAAAAAAASTPSPLRCEMFLAMVDEGTAMEEEEEGGTLSYSPLVPWLEKAQFFLVTPTAQHKSFFAELQTAPAITPAMEEHSIKQSTSITPAMASLSLSPESPPPSTNAPPQNSLDFLQNCPTPLAAGNSTVATPPPDTGHEDHFENPAAMELVTPLALENLPVASPPSGTGRDNHFESPAAAMELVTPRPPQSLVKRYSRFFATADSGPVADSSMTLTPLFVSSPPKTCVLMKPQQDEDSANQEPNQDLSFDAPLIFLKSPFRTPGLFLRQPGSDKKTPPSVFEDMEFTTIKKPGVLLRPAESNKKTPSSDMQFTTIRKAGLPRPGEHTLKRELWCRMEADFASMGDVCKSLFPETQTELPSASSDKQTMRTVGKSQRETRFQLAFFPRRFQELTSKLL